MRDVAVIDIEVDDELAILMLMNMMLTAGCISSGSGMWTTCSRSVAVLAEQVLHILVHTSASNKIN